MLSVFGQHSKNSIRMQRIDGKFSISSGRPSPQGIMITPKAWVCVEAMAIRKLYTENTFRLNVRGPKETVTDIAYKDPDSTNDIMCEREPNGEKRKEQKMKGNGRGG